MDGWMDGWRDKVDLLSCDREFHIEDVRSSCWEERRSGIRSSQTFNREKRRATRGEQGEEGAELNKSQI